jgi:3-deoxy-7-phosphoheptulonate synthase
VSEHDLGDRYASLVDPRLNARQSLDVAFQVAELLHPRSSSRP